MRIEKCFLMILEKHQRVYQMWFYIVNQVRAQVADKLIRLVIFCPRKKGIVRKMDGHLNACNSMKPKPNPKLVYF